MQTMRVGRLAGDVSSESLRCHSIQRRYGAVRLGNVDTSPRKSLFENSEQADPRTGTAPAPGLVLLLRMVRGKVRETCELIRVLEWAKPILAAALN